MIENEGVAKMNGIRSKIINREDSLDIRFVLIAHILAKKNSRFTEIWSLTRFSIEAIENPTDVMSFSSIGLTKD